MTPDNFSYFDDSAENAFSDVIQLIVCNTLLDEIANRDVTLTPAEVAEEEKLERESNYADDDWSIVKNDEIPITRTPFEESP